VGSKEDGGGEEKNPLIVPGTELRPSNSLVAILTELPLLHFIDRTEQKKNQTYPELES
jgi:hypothetical protein